MSIFSSASSVTAGYDTLYGHIELSTPISDLAETPAVQRLRHVRLSNIDSIASPGIAGVTRFEHALGTCRLVQSVGFWRQLSERDQTTLASAALLHDIAITAYGHLLEEAFRYAGVTYSHETKMELLFRDTEPKELGGIELQLFLGFESGISQWATKVFGSEDREQLEIILETLSGVGRFGPCISGQVDLDNIDNVVRLAHHMGLGNYSQLALEMASMMSEVDSQGIVWQPGAGGLVSEWLALRAQLYTHLMFAKRDFIGKAMLTVAIIQALENGQLGSEGYEWTLTDDELVHRLIDPLTRGLNSERAREIAQTVRRWKVGQLWAASPFYWLEGPLPSRSEIWGFRRECSELLGRDCYPHAIPDKRNRTVQLRYADGRHDVRGTDPNNWLMAVVTPRREEFSKEEAAIIGETATEYFAQPLGSLPTDPIAAYAAPSLFEW